MDNFEYASTPYLHGILCSKWRLPVSLASNIPAESSKEYSLQEERFSRERNVKHLHDVSMLQNDAHWITDAASSDANDATDVVLSALNGTFV